MLEFYRGATVYLELTVKLVKSPYTPTTPDGGCTIDVLNENEEKVVGGASMTATADDGVYYYNWTTNADQAKGVYTARGRAIDGATYSIDELQVKLK